MHDRFGERPTGLFGNGNFFSFLVPPTFDKKFFCRNLLKFFLQHSHLPLNNLQKFYYDKESLGVSH